MAGVGGRWYSEGSCSSTTQPSFVPEPVQVKRTLDRLASGRIGSRPSSFAGSRTRVSTAYRAVIDEGSAAVDSLRAAAGFVEDGGLEELEDAIAAAEDTDDHAAARRGRRALRALEQLRTAAERDHFHSGWPTDLGRGNKGADR